MLKKSLNGFFLTPDLFLFGKLFIILSFSVNDMIEEILDGMVSDMQASEHLSHENVRVYFAVIDQFEAQGQDLSHYREIGEEMRQKLTKQNIPFYKRFWEAVKKIANYKIF